MTKWWTSPDGTAHETGHVQIFVRTQSLGEFLIDPGEHADMRWPRSSLAYFCGQCGEIWARMLWMSCFGRVEQWQVVKHPCERCGGGCLAVEGFEPLLAYLPAAVLAREYTIELASYNKE